MSLPAVVPAPSSLEALDAAPFRLASQVPVTGDPDAASALSALLTARAGVVLVDGAGDDTGIELRIAAGGAPESYQLVSGPASVVVTGADAAGLFYGVQTLAQLVTRDGDDWIVPAVRIADAPRFAYRGAMLDVARHFLPVETVTAFIDRAASLKLNVLHLHLTDDQGWRIEIPSRPELTLKASGTSVGDAPGGFFTTADFAYIVAYAASHHMTVVPEIDLPGHTHAIGLAYPELVETPVISPEIREQIELWGQTVPVPGEPYRSTAVGFSSVRIHDEATYDFIADVLRDLAEITPGPYLHIGGDEALGTDPDDFAYFIGRVTAMVREVGKTPVAWHEAGSAPDLAEGTIGQFWSFVTPAEGADVKARAFVEHGGRLILSPADAAYLDMKYDADAELGLTWANGPTSVRRSYEWEPAAVVPGVGDAQILGVEAPLWTETVRDLADVDLLVFPRIASAAEAAWSPAVGTSTLRAWDSFRSRVGALGPLWKSAGIGFHASPEIDWSVE